MKKRKKYVAIMCAALLAFSSLLQGCGKTETVSENSTKAALAGLNKRCQDRQKNTIKIV